MLIVTNAVANAVQHGHAHTITVAARNGSDAIEITIDDDGTGIPVTLLPTAVDRFVKGHGSPAPAWIWPWSSNKPNSIPAQRNCTPVRWVSYACASGSAQGCESERSSYFPVSEPALWNGRHRDGR